MLETWVLSLGQEEPLEKGMETQSNILAGRTPWTEEPGGLQSHGVTKNWKTERLTHMGIFSFSIDFKHGDQCLSFSKNITALL